MTGAVAFRDPSDLSTVDDFLEEDAIREEVTQRAVVWVGRRLPPGPVPGYLMGEPWPGRIEQAEARRRILPDPETVEEFEF